MTARISFPDDLPSKSQIEKAGKYLRNYVRGDIATEDVDWDRLERSIDIVTVFREAHGYPMTKVRLGLASMAKTAGLSNPAITQRHKRVPRIVRKLIRMGDTNLARLEDIGGCRIVVASADEMEAVCKRIRKNWTSAFSRDPRDYVAQPKPLGYRARHFIVIRDGRAVEVQVRTVGQQQWADTVETLDARHGLQLKDGDGPAELMDFLQAVGEIVYRREWAMPVDVSLRDAWRDARERCVSAGWLPSSPS